MEPATLVRTTKCSTFLQHFLVTTSKFQVVVAFAEYTALKSSCVRFKMGPSFRTYKHGLHNINIDGKTGLQTNALNFKGGA